MSNPEQQDELSAAAVARYLKNNPNFFQAYPDVAANLQIPHETGEAVSLMQYQARVLRDKNQTLHKRLQQLVDNARRNDRLFDRTRTLILEIMDADNLDALDAALQSAMRSLYSVDQACLILFVPVSGSNVRQVLDAETHQQMCLPFGNKHAFCGQLDSPLMAQYFSDKSRVGSMAACMLDNHYGIFALGHNDAQYFKSSMDTLFLDFVGEVLSRRLRAWL